MTSEFFYKVSDFGAPLTDGNRSNGFGFFIELEKGFARRALDSKLSETYQTFFQERGPLILESYGWGPGKVRSPYVFVKDEDGASTGLLHFVEVPGQNTCDIDLDLGIIKDLREGKLIRNVYYRPHNVETIHQASTLLSLWLTWAKSMESILER